jgi:beta-glucosidase
MTLEEKCGQMVHNAHSIKRLGLPAYNWWNEGLHGVARAGVATVFPQAIALAAMWDDAFLRQIAEIISTEARAKHHEFQRQGDTNYYTGLTYWSPNINIFRDPRWGRGHETYGECPYLTSRMGVAFCKGLQGEDPTYLKLVATPKHYCVHSGPEGERHFFNARVSQKDLRETYLPAFKACVQEAKAQSVMGAYNRTNGELCCGSKLLLTRILREEFGFTGHVVSDCGAINDFHEHHKITKNPVQSAAMAVKNGCDLSCGCIYAKLLEALAEGLLSEADIDIAAGRLMQARLQLGMFDPPERVPYAQIPYEVNDCDEHHQAAIEAARRSVVLLKNNGILPLAADLDSLLVTGPNADDRKVLLGNYHGWPSQSVTVLEGVRAATAKTTRVWYAEGCKITGTKLDSCAPAGYISEAVSMAQRSQVALLVVGLNSELEGEAGDANNADAAGDKLTLDLPGLQRPLFDALVKTGTSVVVINLSGSAIDLSWAEERAAAVIHAWYPGALGGTAIAEILFGKVSPSGRLPVTFPTSVEQLPDFRDYSMANRTYRYMEEAPLYPFGYGLSYSTFAYSELQLSQASIAAGESVEVSVTVTNTGTVPGDEVVQLYIHDQAASVMVPTWDLRGFRRIHLAPKASETVRFTLTPEALSLITETGERLLEPGTFTLSLGGSQPDRRSEALTGTTTLKAELMVTGAPLPLPY